jgi:hypothetical protein
MTLINCTEFLIGITDDIAVQAELRAGSHEGMEQKVRDAPKQLREVDDHLEVVKTILVHIMPADIHTRVLCMPDQED